ncbi:MAG TPA: energy transducer TonB [Thermoanaerobaculia bacterium]|nr:energy transducer TonB [Thermoanaerobaculia bacterium]
MFDEALIESSNRNRPKGAWKSGVLSIVIHAGLMAALVAAGYYVKENPEVLNKPIDAFVVSMAPPPPPPPPPPPAASVSATQQVRVETPRVRPTESFVQPMETPKEVPVADNLEPSARGVAGGVVGGQEGGVVGGVIGGVVGGVLGGTLGGELGGQLGGTGDAPVRVGGNVTAPTVINRVEPVYTEIARKARVEGIVILEAIIEKDGTVRDVRTLKALPMGLDAAAMDAVRRWKFKPGMLNGRPVPVIFNLTVNFRLQ